MTLAKVGTTSKGLRHTPMASHPRELPQEEESGGGGFLTRIKVEQNGALTYGESTPFPQGSVIYPTGIQTRRIRWYDEDREADSPYASESRPICQSDDGLTGSGVLADDGKAELAYRIENAEKAGVAMDENELDAARAGLVLGDCKTCPEAAWTQDEGGANVKPRCSLVYGVQVSTHVPGIGAVEAEIEFKGANMTPFKSMRRTMTERGWANGNETPFEIGGEGKQRGRNRWGVFTLRALDAPPPAVSVDVESSARLIDDDDSDFPW